MGLVLPYLLRFLAANARRASPDPVVINSIATTALYYIDVQTDFKYILYEGKPRVGVRAMTYALIAVVSTISGACLIKYTPGVLHKYVLTAVASLSPSSPPCPLFGKSSQHAPRMCPRVKRRVLLTAHCDGRRGMLL